jgi:hypothetical protein
MLWLLAVAMMVGSMVYQRLTGPTHPKRGSVTVAGVARPYRLSRSGNSDLDERIHLPDPGQGATGTLSFRRFRTADPFTALPLQPESRQGKKELAAYLPKQPAAGKLEYFLTLRGASGPVTVPRDGQAIVIRFKDPVPTPLLLAHVALMFIGVLLGLRAGLASLVDASDLRACAWATLACLTVGGLVLGPFVQKYAFGAYWTGFPFGGDLTDNKTVLMWGAWFLACGTLLLARRAAARVAVALAAAGMLVVYLIPHSARGSELDYSKLDRGVSAPAAIQTGR